MSFAVGQSVPNLGGLTVLEYLAIAQFGNAFFSPAICVLVRLELFLRLRNITFFKSALVGLPEGLLIFVRIATSMTFADSFLVNGFFMDSHAVKNLAVYT
jgi:hypothetical protein